MPLHTQKAATVDNSNGVAVACAANEDATNTGTLQTIVPVANKTTFAVVDMLGVTQADTATDLSSTGWAATGLFPVGNAGLVSIRALCNTPGATMTGRVVFYDANANPTEISSQLTFRADGVLRAGATGKYLCGSADLNYADTKDGVQAKFYVDSVAGSTTWDIHLRPV